MGNVPCRVEVGMGRLPTIFAGESVLTTDTHMQAVGTGLGCVARVNRHDADASPSRLVLDELLQLVECPRVQASPLSFAEPTPIPNAFKHLKDDGQPMLFGVGDQILANGVVDLFSGSVAPDRKAV